MSVAPPVKTSKKTPILVGVIGVIIGVVLLIGSCLFGAALIDSNPDPATTATEQAFPEPVGEAGPASTPAKKAPTTISGDDVVKAGEDVPAGTYRAAEPIKGGLCYWRKSRDAEGHDITESGVPTGGRPQITLRSGQWFTSTGCPDWIKK